jgi:hypothetical protein
VWELVASSQGGGKEIAGGAYPGGDEEVVIVPEGTGFEAFAIDAEDEEEESDGDENPEGDSHQGSRGFVSAALLRRWLGGNWRRCEIEDLAWCDGLHGKRSGPRPRKG